MKVEINMENFEKVCKKVWEKFLFFGCEDSAGISEFWQNSTGETKL